MAFKDKILPASEVAEGGSLYFLTGAPGTGKTTLIGTLVDMPEYDGRVLVLDAGGGMKSVSDRKNLAVVSVDKWSDLEEARAYLNGPNHPYQWVAIDLVSEAHALCLAEIVKGGKATNDGRATRESYGIANDRFVAMIRSYRVLAEDTGINVIFTSHTQESKDDDSGMILVRANLTPGTLSTVLGIVDVAVYLEIRNKKRQLYLVGNERIWAKTKKPLSYGAVPEKIEDATFEDILEVLKPSKEVMKTNG